MYWARSARRRKSSQRTRFSHPSNLQVESLESRQLLTVAAIEVDKFLWDINGDPNLHSDIQAGDELIYAFEVTNTGLSTLTDVTIDDPLPGLVLQDDVITNFSAYHQDILVDGDVGRGPFASFDRTLESDPFEAKAWDNFHFDSRTVIDAISWDGVYVEPFATGPDAVPAETDFVVEISADDAGAPGSILHTFHLEGGLAGVNDTSVQTTLLAHTGEAGGPAFHYSSAIPFTSIAAGNYWISISAAQTFPSPSPLIDPTWQWNSGIREGASDGFFTYDDTFDDPGDNDEGLVDSEPRPVVHESGDLSFEIHGAELVDFDGTLEPGESIVFMGTYIVTQEDVIAGEVVNEVTASGVDPSNAEVTDSDTEVVTIDRPDTGIELDKFLWDINGSPELHTDIHVGDELIYSFNVTNTGATALSNIELTDPLPGLTISDQVARPFIAYDQPLVIPGDLRLGPFASVDRTLASDPFEAKVWDNFSLDSRTVLDGLSWAGAYIEPFGVGETPETDFLIEISADDSGLPGEVLHTFSLDGGEAGVDDGNVSSTLLGHTAENGGPVYSYDAMLPFTAMQAGDYWLSVTAMQTFPNPEPTIDPTWQWHLGTNFGGADGFYSYDDTFDDPGDNDEGLVDGTPHPAVFENLDLAFSLHASELVDFDGTLQPGETIMYMGTYIVTQPDVAAGQVVNTATVTADTTLGFPVSDSDQEIVLIERPDSGILLDKFLWDINSKPLLHTDIQLGDEFIYAFNVTNTGSTPLTDVEVLDPLPGLWRDADVFRQFDAVSQPLIIPGDLDLGPFASVDRTLASDPLEAKAWDNFSLSSDTVIDSMSWAGAYIEPFALGPGVVTPETDFLVEIFHDSAGLPGAVAHSFHLPGGAAGINDPQITTRLLGHTAEDGGPVYQYDALLPFTNVRAGDYWISITALQTFPNPAPTIDPTWQWHVGTNPGGSDGFYTYDDTFDDPGDGDAGLVDGTPFPAVKIAGDLAFTLRASREEAWNGMVAPGETVMFMGVYEVRQSDIDRGFVLNEATANGTLPDGEVISDSDKNIQYIDQHPAIDVTKLVNGEDANEPRGPVIALGDDVTWTYEVTNSGNVTLSNVAVVDDQGVVPVLDAATDVGGDGLLSPGEKWVYTATGTPTLGQYQNLATATADSPAGDVVSDSDPAHYFGCDQSGDINGDGTVGFADFIIMSTYYGEEGGPAQGDVNCNGTVDFADFILLSMNYDLKVHAATAQATDDAFADDEENWVN